MFCLWDIRVCSCVCLVLNRRGWHIYYCGKYVTDTIGISVWNQNSLICENWGNIKCVQNRTINKQFIWEVLELGRLEWTIVIITSLRMPARYPRRLFVTFELIPHKQTIIHADQSLGVLRNSWMFITNKKSLKSILTGSMVVTAAHARIYSMHFKQHLDVLTGSTGNSKGGI